MSQPDAHPQLHLHTYFRSSCSARVRTALHLKGLSSSVTYTYIPLLTSAQLSPSYTSLNPSASVPTLTLTTSNEKIVIRQSVAILEFLEEYFSSPDIIRLLPPVSDPVGRARVRELVNIVACDVQPVTNLRVLKKVKTIAGEDKGDQAMKEWAKDFMGKGLEAYDRVAEGYAGEYSVGDEVSMADVCLAPAVEGAVRYGVDVERLKTVWRVYNAVKVLDAFKQGDWRHQEDTPEEFRV
ncbi:Maleylacetoacetate isomerase [Cadophora sp. DSE1049]|nr:Maleylacetoacetate isomerase [Cadophora sp. DSE1049]